MEVTGNSDDDDSGDDDEDDESSDEEEATPKKVSVFVLAINISELPSIVLFIESLQHVAYYAVC